MEKLKKIVKQFFWEFIILGIIFYFCMCMLIGFAILPFDDDVFIAIANTLFIALAGLICLCICWFLLSLIIYEINKIKAVKRYMLLPLSTQKVKELCKNGIFKDSEDYIKYICEQIRYKSVYGQYKTVYFTQEDMIQLCDTIENVFGEPFIITHDFYDYFWNTNTETPSIPFVCENNAYDFLNCIEGKSQRVVFTTENTKVVYKTKDEDSIMNVTKKYIKYREKLIEIDFL